MKNQRQVFAVLRCDAFLKRPPSEAVVVKEVVDLQSVAESEVERLNGLAAGKGYFYFWQATRYVAAAG